MKIKYCVTSQSNPLYNGEFLSHAKYKTFGQQSFIIDFITAARRFNCSVDLLIEGKESFPLYELLLESCHVVEFASGIDQLHEGNIVIIDKLSEEAIDRINTAGVAFYFIHNAGERVYKKIPEICRKLVCMSETAMKFQQNYIHKDKLLLCHQGVDIIRFSLQEPPLSNYGAGRIKVLLFTRLIQQKKATITSVLNELLKQVHRYSITVLGDGDLFWEISNTYGNDITVINHIPCNSIPIFLPGFDIVISSARGVMEACASGIPSFCAGFGYAGLVSEEKIPHLMVRNLTGFGESAAIPEIHDEIDRALLVDRSYWRAIASRYFNMDDFVARIIREAGNSLIDYDHHQVHYNQL